MIKKDIGYSYNDLTIVPSVISEVKSRSEVDVLDKNDRLPIFVAPMSSVINHKNYEIFEKNNLYTVIPRSVNYEDRIKLFGNYGTLVNDNNYRFIALSLNEFNDCFCNEENVKNNANKHFNVCVDIANGHMQYLYDLCKKAKELSYHYGYELVIMTGNIANPETYREICMMSINYKPVIDYIRVGIGGGSGCFIDGTKIKTDKGEKNIEDICIDDRVLTIDGSYQRVSSRTRYKTNNLLKINNEITCTPNHKFFVINKSDKELVNKQNLEKIGFWIEAENLDKEKHLLVKLEQVKGVYVFQKYYKEIFKFVEIETIEIVNDEQYVNDLSVETNHNYVANNYIVHNCITSSNTSIHYPMASLIDECNNIRKELQLKNCTKIIADGGIRNYSDVIKALALGADYVMIGSVFAKCLESCGAKMFTNYRGEKEMCSAEAAYELYEKGAQLYTRFYGMASADGQIAINHKKTKTAEGITKMLPVEYKLHKWVENMRDYLRSAMSYCGAFKLKDFIGQQILIVNSPAEIAAVNK